MQWLDDFVTFLEGRGDSEKTVGAYVSGVRQFTEWYGAQYGHRFEPRMLTGMDVRRYLRYLRVGRKLKPATINQKNTALRALVKFGLDDGQIHEQIEPEILAGAEYLDVVDSGPKWLEQQEFNKLQAMYRRAIHHELLEGREARHRMAVQQYAVMMVQAGGGLRINEALGLDVDDLMFGERKGRVVIREGKGGRYAEQLLNIEAIRAISSWLELRGDHPGPVFLSQKGNRLSDRQVQRYFAEMARQAGISEAFTPHSLRHMFIKEAERKAGLAVAQRLARHKRVETTMRYAQAGQEELEQAVERIFD